jgi:hypothetical protein
MEFIMMSFMVAAGLATAETAAKTPLTAGVEVEEEVYSYTPATNGAGPMWTFGNTCIVRLGEQVLASGLETLPDYKPLNNVRWTLFKRLEGGWKLQARGLGTHEREPCPLVVFPNGHALLSVNPSAAQPGEYDAAAQPGILDFELAAPTGAVRRLTPVWDRQLAFHAHTYRSFAADSARGEFILFYNLAHDRAYWTFANLQGQWLKQGALEFPFGTNYDQPQPIRICYPTVALKDRAVYLCGISDIEEPYAAWRDFKRQLTGQKWDYDVRRLFYTWCDDITTGRFHDWVEIASRDKTAGWILPCDLYLDPAGLVHLLWTERALDERLRPKFFPAAKQSIALNYAVVRKGEVLRRLAIHEWKEGEASGERAGRGQFHVMPDGRLLVYYHLTTPDAAGKAVAENRLVEVVADGAPVVVLRKVPLQKPFAQFYTAGRRAGCAPSQFIDVFGEVNLTMRYARLRVEPAPAAGLITR